MTDSSWPNARANPFAPARLRLLGRAEALLAVAGIGAWAYDPRSAILWWSDETRRLHGVDAAYVPETVTALDFYAPAGRDRVRAALADCIAAGVPWDVEVPLHRADGRRIWVRARGRRMDDAAGTVMGTFEDVTERRRAAREHERMALVVNQMTNAALITDAWGRTRWVNNAFIAFTGFTLAEVAGRLPEDYLVGPASDLSDLADVTAAMMAGEPFLREVVIHDAAGTAVWIELRVDPVRDTGGALTGFIAMTHDISARRDAAARAARELALRAGAETLLRDVIEGIPAALTVYDADERLVLVNDSYRTILPGAATLAALGDRLEDIVRRKVAAGHYAAEITAAATPAEQAAWTADYLHRHRSAAYTREFHLSDGRWVQARNARSTSGNIVSIRTDITRLKYAEAELRHVAEHDPLTGLVNRPVLMRRLAGHTACATGGTVVVIDVDFFKSLNDSLGHGAGDLLLRLVARRLQRLVGPGATVARLGGDEFALIVPGLVAADAVAAFLDRLLAAQRSPVRLGTNRYLPSVSVGVAVFAGGRDTADLVLSNADAALYEAKRNGRGRFALFDAELAARVERRTSLADRLRVAIAQRRLQVALQPQLRLVDGAITGFEALARWHDGGEWVPPAEFVPIAEDVGLAQALGTAVMDRALAAHAGLVAAGLVPGILAVNVSTAQLLADDFLDVVRSLLARHGLPPQQLEIEVTETVLLDRSGSRIVQILAALRDDGISVSLDDFGTGYASLSSLRAFNVDRIKIDAGFTRAIDGHASGTAGEDGGPGVATDAGLIARTIVVLGNGLGLEVIAEGVETPAQLAFLAASGCTAVQGYLIAPPMLPPAAAAWLAAINAAAADRAAVAARLQARIASRIVAE